MEDPFASLIKHCKPTASQEEKLRTCPFARESEIFLELSDSLSSSPTPTPPEPTAIVMVSLPDSCSVDQSASLENEEFQTPPEQANSSSQPYLSGSDDPRPPTAALSSQSYAAGDKQAKEADEDGAEHQGIVDLGTECDDLGFSLPREINGGVYAPECSDSANGIHGNKRGGDDFGEYEFFKGDNDEPASKRTRVSKEDLEGESPTLYVGETEPIAIEIKEDESVNTDVMDLECEEAGEKEKMMENVDSSVNAVVVCRGALSGNGSSILGSKRKEGIEKLAIVNSVGKAANEKVKCDHVANGKGKYNDVEKCDVVGSREFPLSIRGGEKSIGGEKEIGRLDLKDGSSFKDLVEALKVLLGKANDGCKDADILETAKNRGWNFPRPRWWPPEGFDD